MTTCTKTTTAAWRRTMAPAASRAEDKRGRFACRGTLQGNPRLSGQNGWTPSFGETRDRENGGGVIARFTRRCRL
ncbi:unnamed protein product [Ectocarpus sp. 4 AP-2014]